MEELKGSGGGWDSGSVKSDVPIKFLSFCSPSSQPFPLQRTSYNYNRLRESMCFALGREEGEGGKNEWMRKKRVLDR
jgi:hypothetical protein